MKLDAYHLVNARLGIDFAGGEVYLFGRNLFDEQYEVNGNYYGPGVTAGTPARGRVVGVGAALRF